MIVLWILLSILVLLLLLSILSARMVLEYREDITLSLSVLFLNFRLFPAKKEKIRLSDYSKKAIEKQKRKEIKKAKKEKTKKQAVKNNQEKTQSKDILEKLKDIRELVTALLDKTFGHLSIGATRIRILVATGDAASTAILCGAVSGAVSLLMETLDHFGKLKTKARDEITVAPDYLAEQTTADIRLVFSLRVWQILDILLKSFTIYIKTKKQKAKS
ncbi:MAG: DUF2953 domain-containing protein [Clostridia bacterium]|nr:DUF2953 domain-containing protein [Clostridia bacterium]